MNHSTNDAPPKYDAARGLITASPVMKIREAGTDAANTEKPIFTASSCSM